MSIRLPPDEDELEVGLGAAPSRRSVSTIFRKPLVLIALSTFVAFSLLLAWSRPVTLFQIRSNDAPFSVPASTIRAALTCPKGLHKRPGGIVLLVHGTGATGSESWETGPYNIVLPTAGQGYDVCWVDLPGRSLVDAQLSAEYVAFAVQHLASQSATGKVSIIGHSQGGGLNPQWALVFWPSIQLLVSHYIALAPDFHGTEEGLLVCNAFVKGTCEASVWQQTIGSRYLAAQNFPAPDGGGQALVPTTSIYTLTDDVIQPETPPLGPTSYLKGASVHALQDLNVCGPAHAASHFSMIVDPAAFGLAKLALETGGPIDISQFDKNYCTYLKDDVLFNPANLVPTLASAVADALAFGTAQRAAAEPPLQACHPAYSEGPSSADQPAAR